MAVEDLLTDPKFLAMPLDAQLRISRQDQRFAALDPKVQGTILYHAKSTHLGQPTGEDKGPEDAGFFSTLAQDAMKIPGQVLHPLDAIKNATEARLALRDKPGIGNKVASYIPFAGPMMAQAGEDFGSGKFGEGSAHALEVLAPSVMKGVGAIPAGESTVGGIARAGLKGGVKAAIAPVSYRGLQVPGGATLAGAAAGRYLGGEMGEFAGGSLPFLKGAYEGGRDAFRGPTNDYEPFQVKPSVKAKMRFTPGEDSGAGKSYEARGRGFEPTVDVSDIQEPFKVNANIKNNLKYTPGERSGQGPAYSKFSGSVVDAEPLTVSAPEVQEGFKVNPNIKRKMKFTPRESSGSGRSYAPVKIKKPTDLSAISGEVAEESGDIGEAPKQNKLKVNASDELPPGHESWLSHESTGVDPGPRNIKENITVDRTAKSNRLKDQIKKNEYEVDKLPTSARDPFWKALTSETKGVNWNPSQETVDQIIRDLRKEKR